MNIYFRKNKRTVSLLSAVLFFFIFSIFMFSSSEKLDPEFLKAKLSKVEEIKKSKILNKLAKIYWWNKDKRITLGYGKSALEFAKKFNQEREIVYALINVSHANRRLKKFKPALKNIKKALKLAKKRMNDIEILDVLNSYRTIYDYYDFRKNLKKNLEISKKIEMVSLRVGDKKSHAFALHANGSLSSLMKDYSQAYFYRKRALEAYKKLGENTIVVQLITYLAAHHRRMNEYDQALNYIQEAELIGTKNNLPNVRFRIYYGYGKIYEESGDTEKALSFYEKGLNYAIERKSKTSQLRFYPKLGEIYISKGKFDKAISSYLLKAIEIAENESFRKEGSNYSLALLYMGIAYNKKKEFKKSLIFFNKALKNTKKFFDFEVEAMTYLNLGKYYIDLKQFENAISSTKSGLKIVKNHNLNSLKASFYKQMYEFYLKIGNKKKAIKYKKKL